MFEFYFRGKFYHVSSQGKVYHKGIETPQHDNGHGYKTVTLRSKKFYVHRLVAQLYIPFESITQEVNHKDGNKSNNKVDNLEWVTRSQNQLHAYRVLKRNHGYSQKGRCGFLHHRSRPVVQIDKTSGAEIQTFGSLGLAAKAMNVSQRAIWSAIHNVNRFKSSAGFKWR